MVDGTPGMECRTDAVPISYFCDIGGILNYQPVHIEPAWNLIPDQPGRISRSQLSDRGYSTKCPFRRAGASSSAEMADSPQYAVTALETRASVQMEGEGREAQTRGLA